MRHGATFGVVAQVPGAAEERFAEEFVELLEGVLALLNTIGPMLAERLSGRDREQMSELSGAPRKGTDGCPHIGRLGSTSQGDPPEEDRPGATGVKSLCKTQCSAARQAPGRDDS